MSPESMATVRKNDFCCAIDGDADRLIYFYPRADGAKEIVLLDGDKIAALVAGLLKDLVNELPPELCKSVSIGIVQTAYANGNSSKYLTEEIQCTVVVTPTGVKHLHKAAHEFHIGIYFEANGHGTVLFNQEFLVSA